MKVLVLIGGGRSGIDSKFIDGHPQIMQFPHHFHFNEFWKR